MHDTSPKASVHCAVLIKQRLFYYSILDWTVNVMSRVWKCSPSLQCKYNFQQFLVNNSLAGVVLSESCTNVNFTESFNHRNIYLWQSKHLFHWPTSYILNQCVLICLVMQILDLRQVGGFLRVLRFPPPIKLSATI